MLPGGVISAVTPASGSCLHPQEEDDPSRPPALLSCLASADSPTQSHAPRGRRGVTRLVFQHRTTSFVGGVSLFPQSEVDAASTALLVAAFNGREDRVRELLLREETNPNISYSNGNRTKSLKSCEISQAKVVLCKSQLLRKLINEKVD